MLEPSLLDELIDNIASLASVYHKPPSTFVEGKTPALRHAPSARAAREERQREEEAENEDAGVRTEPLEAAAPAAPAAAPFDLPWALDLGHRRCPAGRAGRGASTRRRRRAAICWICRRPRPGARLRPPCRRRPSPRRTWAVVARGGAGLSTSSEACPRHGAAPRAALPAARQGRSQRDLRPPPRPDVHGHDAGEPRHAAHDGLCISSTELFGLAPAALQVPGQLIQTGGAGPCRCRRPARCRRSTPSTSCAVKNNVDVHY